MFDKYIATGRKRTLLKKLIWMQMLGLTGASLPWQTFTGNPLQFNAPKAHTLRSTTVEFSPKQDLHGYDSPWPAGGGKNKLPYPFTPYTYPTEITVTDNGDGTVTVNGTCTATKYYYFFGSSNDAVPSWVKPSTDYITGGGRETSNNLAVQFIFYGKNGETTIVISDTASKTSPADFTNFACACVLQIASGTYNNVLVKPRICEGTTATSFAPYSNECPISGWTGVDIYGAGENILDTNKIARYSMEGTEYSAMYFDKAGTYCFKAFGSSNSQYLYARVQNANGTFYTSQTVIANQSKASRTITITDGQKLWFYNAYASRGVESTQNAINAWQITCCLGDYATEYHAYTGHTYSVTWTDEAGTVYGGTAEVAEDGTATGSGTYGYALLNDPSLWKDYDTFFGYDLVFSDAKNTGSSFTGLMSSYVPIDSSNETYGRWNAAAYHRFIIYSSKTLAEIQADATAGKIAIAYELATPVPFAVTASSTPTAVQGINTIWSDANGDVTVEARAEAVNLSALQSLNMLLGGRYYNNGTADEPTDEEALDILLGGNTK